MTTKEKKLADEGWIIPEVMVLMSEKDVANKFGKSKQYWGKVMGQGLIRNLQTSAGRITTDYWVEKFINRHS